MVRPNLQGKVWSPRRWTRDIPLVRIELTIGAPHPRDIRARACGVGHWQAGPRGQRVCMCGERRWAKAVTGNVGPVVSISDVCARVEWLPVGPAWKWHNVKVVMGCARWGMRGDGLKHADSSPTDSFPFFFFFSSF
jgi:hypothetical protein